MSEFSDRLVFGSHVIKGQTNSCCTWWVPRSFLALLLILSLHLTSGPAHGQDVCQFNGETYTLTGVSQSSLNIFFASAGKAFTGVGDSATLQVPSVQGHDMFQTVTVLEQTAPATFTVSFTLLVTGCNAVPVLSPTGLVALVGLLLGIGGLRFRRPRSSTPPPA